MEKLDKTFDCFFFVFLWHTPVAYTTILFHILLIMDM